MGLRTLKGIGLLQAVVDGGAGNRTGSGRDYDRDSASNQQAHQQPVTDCGDSAGD